MDKFGSGKSSLFERVDFSLNRLLSSLSKFKYSDSTQTVTVSEAMFDLTRLMFALLFAYQIYAHARYFTKSKQMQAVYCRKINHRDLRPLYSASHRAINVLSMSRIEKELYSLFLGLFSPFSNKKD